MLLTLQQEATMSLMRLGMGEIQLRQVSERSALISRVLTVMATTFTEEVARRLWMPQSLSRPEASNGHIISS